MQPSFLSSSVRLGVSAVSTAPKTRRISWTALLIVVAIVLILSIIAVVFNRINDSLNIADAKELLDRSEAIYQQVTDEADTLSDRERSSLIEEATRLERSALEYMEKYAEQNPSDFESLDEYADILAERSQNRAILRQAIEISESIYQERPEDPRFRENLLRLADLTQTLALVISNQRESLAELDKSYSYIRKYMDLQGDDKLDARTYQVLAAVQALRADLRIDGAAEEAIGAFEKLNPDERDISTASLLANVYFTQGEFDQAEQLLLDLIDINPDSPSSHMMYYMFLTKFDQRIDDARRQLEEALRCDPDSIDVRLEAARFAINQGDPEAAATHIDAIPEEARKNPMVAAQEAQLNLKSLKLEPAIAKYREALRLGGSGNAEINWNLAHTLLLLNRVDQATPVIERYRALVGEDDTKYEYLVALKEWRSENPQEAIEILERIEVLVEDRLLGQLHYIRGEAYQDLDQLEAAEEAFSEATQVSPQNAPAWLKLAELERRRSGDEGAIRVLDQGLLRNGNDPTMLARKASLLFRSQLRRQVLDRQWRDFTQFLREARSRVPSLASLIRLEAQYLAIRGQLDEAQRLLQDELEKQPRSSRLRVDLASTLVRRDRRDEALELLQDAPATTDNVTTLIVARSRILAGMGRLSSARKVLEDQLGQVEDSQKPILLQVLAALAARQNDVEAALATFRRWAELQPESTAPPRALLQYALSTKNAEAVRTAIRDLEQRGYQNEQFLEAARKIGSILEQFDQLSDESLDETQEAAILAQIRQDIEAYRQLNPDAAESYLLAGVVAERERAYEQAITDYLEAIKRDGKDTALQRLRIVLANMNDPARVEQVAAEVLTLLPDDAVAQTWQASVLNLIGKDEIAEQQLRRLCEEDPGTLAHWEKLIRFLEQKGRHREALAIIEEEISELEFDYPNLLLAQCYRIIGENEKAADRFQRAIAEYPDNIGIRKFAISFYLNTNRAEQAEASLRYVIDLDPNQTWAIDQLALVLSARRYDYQAWKEALDLVTQDDRVTSLDRRQILAQVLSRATDNERRKQAIEIMSEVVAETPNNPEPRQTLAALYDVTGQTEQALEQAAVAAQLAPRDPAIIGLYTRLLLKADQLGEAGFQLEQLAKVAPNTLPALDLRIRYLLAQGQRDEARKLVEASLSARQNQERLDVLGQRLINVLADSGELAMAEQIVESFLAEQVRSQRVLAQRLAGEGRIDDALVICQRIAGQGDVKGAAISALVAVSEPGRTDEQLAQTADLMDRAHESNPDDFEVLNALSLVRHMQGRYDEELAIYDEITEREPPDQRYLNNKAWVLGTSLGRESEALEIIDEAVASVGPEPDFLDTRGVILTRLGRFDEAIRVLSEASQRSERPILTYHLAYAYYMDGQLERFRETLQKARELGFKPELLEPFEREAYDQISL